MAGEETVDLEAAVGALAERGHRRMLAEGGPHLLAQLLEARLLDELCLTVGPLMAGPGANRIVAGALPTAPPLPLALAHVLADDSFLFCRYIQKRSLGRTGLARAPAIAKPRPSQGRGSRPRSNPVATAAARSLTPSLA